MSTLRTARIVFRRCSELNTSTEIIVQSCDCFAVYHPPRAIGCAAHYAARQITRCRENWLNPPDLVHRVPEVVPGFPDRILPNDAQAAAILKKRTLTNLYNERPTWLQNAHAKLDTAVANAYGFPPDISDNDALAHLLALNHTRAK
ncbi:MAG TPA: hypothetical protein PKJ41_14305 [Bryobacteraceae bacterium]|nr:hypothetical protein [Bryobacteraceae bacterium]HPT25920.1 hypothetical protein [Bryobacteraceae bacterium]